MQHIDGTQLHTMPVTPDPKGFLGLLMQACFTPVDGRKEPPIHEYQIVVSRDSTPVKFLGARKQQAHNWGRGFSTINAPPNSVFQYDPTIQTAQQTPILEIADVLAYSCAHALTTPCNTPALALFQEQFSRIKFWTRTQHVFA